MLCKKAPQARQTMDGREILISEQKILLLINSALSPNNILPQV
jgi:hypothetical protein